MNTYKDLTLNALAKALKEETEVKAKKKVKAPKDFTVEEVLEMLQSSMQDHDVGWATITQAPVLVHPNSIDPANKAFIIFKPIGWNTTDKKFKITIEEA